LRSLIWRIIMAAKSQGGFHVHPGALKYFADKKIGDGASTRSFCGSGLHQLFGDRGGFAAASGRLSAVARCSPARCAGCAVHVNI
jgi:hypothetical protein